MPNPRTIKFEDEVNQALEFWNKETGIPIKRMVNEGTMLRIKELENIFKKTHKDKERS